jgi:hypothetical protein
MRYFLFVVFIFALMTQARADAFSDKYTPSNAGVVVSYMARNGVLKLDTDEDLLEFVRITDCNVFKMISDSPFKQQEVNQALRAQLPAEPVTNPEQLRISIPTIFSLKGYSFETQSITLLPQSQIKKANLFDVGDGTEQACGKRKVNERKAIPLNYAVRLTYPVSFFRIPMKQDIAEALLVKMDKRSASSPIRVVYGTLYLQVEPIAPETQRWGATTRGVARGQLDAIDLYLDYERTTLIKRFNFMDNY